MLTRFDKFEDIAFTINSVKNIPKITYSDVKIDNANLKGYQFYYTSTGYVNFDINKLSLYKNISVLHSYYMRGETLINPLANFIYIGQRDYDSIKQGNVVSLFVTQVGLDPYGRLDHELFVPPMASNRTFKCAFDSDVVKCGKFNSTSTGEIEFFVARAENGVAVATQQTHIMLYKFCNIKRDLFQYIEAPYVFATNGKQFMIDGDDIEYGDDPDFVPLSHRIQYTIQHGLDPLTLQMVVKDHVCHLRLWPGRYCNWLDWVLYNVLDFEEIPVCIICGNTQYNTHQYEWNPAPSSLINSYLMPEITVDRS